MRRALYTACVVRSCRRHLVHGARWQQEAARKCSGVARSSPLPEELTADCVLAVAILLRCGASCAALVSGCQCCACSSVFQWERALELWNAESDAAKHADSMRAMHEDLVGQQQKAAAGFLRRWYQRNVAKCVASWQAWTRAAQQRQHAMLQVQRRMRHSHAYSMLMIWHSCAFASARAKRLIVRAMQRREAAYHGGISVVG